MMDDDEATPIGGWDDPAQVDWYLSRPDRLEGRTGGERLMTDLLPEQPMSMLDLGCGDGRLTDLVRQRRLN